MLVKRGEIKGWKIGYFEISRVQYEITLEAERIGISKDLLYDSLIQNKKFGALYSAHSKW